MTHLFANTCKCEEQYCFRNITYTPCRKPTHANSCSAGETRARGSQATGGTPRGYSRTCAAPLPKRGAAARGAAPFSKPGCARKCIFRKFCKFLAGSFSAVSKRIFARKYAFDSIFQALQDLHPFAPLQSQNFRKKSV